MILPTSSVGMTGTVCATGAPDASTMGDQDDPTNPIQNETLSSALFKRHNNQHEIEPEG